MPLFFHYNVMFMRYLAKWLQFWPGFENIISFRVEVCIKVTVRVDLIFAFDTL